MFVQMYTEVFPSGTAELFSQEAFRAFDTNGDGKIDFKEFIFALHLTSAASATEKLQWAFRMYDVDGNGKIDLGEMKRLRSQLRGLLTAGSEGL